jgi:hypothetical protein
MTGGALPGIASNSASSIDLMSVTVVLAIVAVLIGIVTVLAKKKSSAVPEPQRHEVSILMLGFRGSGKTLMLASLFKHFRLGGPSGITLLTDEGAERELEQLVDRIQDTSADFLPDSTGLGDSRTWTFTVRVLAGQGKSGDAFRLRYLDYAGEYAEAASGVGEDTGENEFTRTLRSADIVIGVIDGEKVRRLLTQQGQQRITHEIDRLLRLLVRAEQSCVHLVISKWDRLAEARPRSFTLDDVVRGLEDASAGFRDFRRNPKFSRIRIIPVSTLGRGFAEVRPDGTTVKKPGGRWKPENVELPFYCALPDILSGDITLMSANARPGSTDRTTVSAERLAQITLGVFALADIALKVSTHGLSVTVPFSAIGGQIRKALTAPARTAPVGLGRREALAHVLKTSFEHSEAFEHDEKWYVHGPEQP